MNLMKKLNLAFDLALDVMATLAAIILIFIMVCVCMDALGRYFFNHPFIWVTQITEYSLLYITFLGSAWLLRREGHVMMEIVVSRLSRGVQAILGIISSLIGVFIYVFFLWYGVVVTWDHWQRGIFDPTILQFPKAPVIAIIPIGSFFLIVQFVRRAYKFYLLWRDVRTAAVGPEGRSSLLGV